MLMPRAEGAPDPVEIRKQEERRRSEEAEERRVAAEVALKMEEGRRAARKMEEAIRISAEVVQRGRVNARTLGEIFLVTIAIGIFVGGAAVTFGALAGAAMMMWMGICIGIEKTNRVIGLLEEIRDRGKS